MDDSAPTAAVGFGALVAEAKRRNVFRMAGIFAAVAWIVLQLADVLLEPLGLPPSAINILLIVLAACFPLALALAWVFEFENGALRRTGPLLPGQHQTPSRVQVLDGILLLMALGVGYLYLERLLGLDAAPPDQVESPAVAVSPAIVVLPFDNLSGSDDNAFFAAGIHEDILTNLSQIPGLTVISRTSSTRIDTSLTAPEIAAALNVTHLLEGSVRRAGDQVRITVQLIEASDRHLWAKTYDRTVADIFAVQSEVAAEIADQLQLHLDVETQTRIATGPTSNLDAYNLYSEARARVGRSAADTEAAMATLDKALALDPDMAQAHATMVVAVRWRLFEGGEWEPLRERVMHHAERAMALGPQVSDAHVAAGIVAAIEANLSSDRAQLVARSEEHFRQALALDANNQDAYMWFGNHLYFSGRYGEASRVWREGLRRDPISHLANLWVGLSLSAEGRQADALPYVERALELEPDYATGHNVAGLILTSGDPVRALMHFNRAHKLDARLVQAPVNISRVFQALGADATAVRWLDVATTVSPNHENVLIARADLLNAGGRFQELEAVAAEWRAHNPRSSLAKRASAGAAAGLAQQALDREDKESALAYRMQAHGFNQDYVSPLRQSDGHFTVTFDGAWGLLGYALNAKVLGLHAEGDKALNDVLSFYGREQFDASAFGDFHQLVAHAALGNMDGAVASLEAAYDNGFYWTWLVTTYGLDTNRLNMYHGLNKQVAFIEFMNKVRARNAETLARIRQETPELLAEADRNPAS